MEKTVIELLVKSNYEITESGKVYFHISKWNDRIINGKRGVIIRNLRFTNPYPPVIRRPFVTSLSNIVVDEKSIKDFLEKGDCKMVDSPLTVGILDYSRVTSAYRKL